MSSFVSLLFFYSIPFLLVQKAAEVLERRKIYTICNHSVQGCNLINCYTMLHKKNIIRQVSSLKLNPEEGGFSACLSIIKKG